VELHEGKIEAISDGSGKGSTFIVNLPRIAAPNLQSSHSDREVTSNAASRRILMVEDSEDSREGLRAWLELSGHEIYEAANGIKAVEMALTLRPDLMPVDIGLPGIDGYKVAKRIRTSSIGPMTTMVAVSGYGQSEYVERAKQAGFDDYIIKPVKPESLTKLIFSISERLS